MPRPRPESAPPPRDTAAAPVARLRLDFRHHDTLAHIDEPVRCNLSVCEQTGPCLWLASDETASVERLVTADWKTFADHRSFALADYFDLPEGPDGEVDIEGLAADGGWLWVVGSHSLRRDKPKPDEVSGAEALARLSRVRPSANRYLLGRIPLAAAGADGVPDLAARAEADGAARAAACLKMQRGGNALAKALRRDPHLGPFMGIPAKENGFDVEGLAARGDRVFLGLRGPVLRGWATIVELEVKQKGGLLKLRRIGDEGARYRKRFVNLDGLGIRELTFDGDDLLILAGPTMDLDGPVTVYRWRDALHEEHRRIVPRQHLLRELDLPFGEDADHAEGIALFRAPDRPPMLLAVYDSPAPERLHADGTGIDADLFALRTGA